MADINNIKIKLIQKICESDNYYLLSSFLKNFEAKSPDIVAESPSIFESEKPMTEEEVDEYFIRSIALKRNNIPRKSLNYKTPIEVFLSHICKEELSNLI